MVAAEKDFEPGQYEGRNIWFGVREFAMAAAMNGIHYMVVAMFMADILRLY